MDLFQPAIGSPETANTRRLKMLTKITLAAAVLTLGFAAPSFAAPAFNGPFGHGPNAQPAPFSQPAAYGKPGNFHRPAQWELVGQRLVNFRGSRDNIPVMGRDRHQQIMVCVYNQPVRIADLGVTFRNGAKQDIAVRNTIGAGQCTRAIDLKGQKRDLKSVNLAYKALGFGRGALVKVFAR
jgi:hypothetical protein